MNNEQILSAIQELSSSQGFYGCLYRNLTDGSEWAKKIMNILVKQKFNDKIDLILFLEVGGL